MESYEILRNPMELYEIHGILRIHLGENHIFFEVSHPQWLRKRYTYKQTAAPIARNEQRIEKT